MSGGAEEVEVANEDSTETGVQTVPSGKKL